MNNYEKKLLNGGDYATAQLSKTEFTKLLEVYDWQEIFEGYLSEFYIDNDKIWRNWSLRSFHEVSIVAVAVVWLLVLYNRWENEKERKNRFKKAIGKKKKN